MKAANLPTFLKSKNTENQTFVSSHHTVCGMELCSQKQTLFLTRYGYAVVSGMPDMHLLSVRSSVGYSCIVAK